MQSIRGIRSRILYIGTGGSVLAKDSAPPKLYGCPFILGAEHRGILDGLVKRGLDMRKFDQVILLLITDTPLPPKNRPHMLTGEWRGFHECHLAPDWLLIYDLDDAEVLALHRMGTHSDLFE